MRIVATSHFMRSVGDPGAAGTKYQFAYRIRVENINDLIDKEKNEEKSFDLHPSAESHKAVQLLGRTWKISECGPLSGTPSSILSHLLEEEVSGLKNNQKKKQKEDGENRRLIQMVHEPKTGAGKFNDL